MRTSLADWLAAITSSPGPTGKASREGDPSVWFERDAILLHQPFHGGAGIQQAQSTEARRIYVRIIPERFKTVPPKALAVHQFQGSQGNAGVSLLGPYTSADGGVNGDGVLRYALTQPGKPTTTWTATQWFRDTGELWSFDTARLREGRFYIGPLIAEVANFLARGLSMLDAFGASGEVSIEIGAVGLLGTQWAGQFNYERSDALLDRVQVRQARRKWDQLAIAELLLDVANEMAEAYGRPHFDQETVRRMISQS